MNVSIREAMVEAIHEIAASSTQSILADFIDLIKTIREELILTYMADKYVELHIWPVVRKNIELTKALINATTNFTLAIEDLEGAIKEFANKAVCFTNNSLIIDDDLMGKSVSQAELEKTLRDNTWLFFLLFCSTHIYLVNGVGSQYIVETPKGVKR